MNAYKRYRHLIVDEGDRARTEGILLELPCCWGLGIVDAEEQWIGVPITIRSAGVDLAAFHGSRVVATGRWESGALVVADAPDVLPPLGGPLPTFGEDRPVLHPKPPLRDPRERRLMKDGVLLDRWPERDPTSGESRQVALVSDVERARPVLTALHGPSVRIVLSRWEQATLTELSAVFHE